MDKLQLIAEIKRLVGKADIEHALQRLIEELEKAGSSLANDAIQAQSLFQKTQKDEKQGLVSFDNARLNYNLVTDQILDLLEVLKKEDGSEVKGKPAKRLLPWIVGGVLALGVVIAVLVFSNKKEDTSQQTVVDPNCPGFDSTSVFKVLVFPFQPLEEKRTLTNTHVTIKNKLVALSEALRINASIQNYKYDFGLNNNYDNYPATPSVAAKTLASNCQANLIIIGTTEMLASGSITRLKYKFLNSEYTQLKITENSVIDTLTSVSSILSENSLLTADIENVMKILFGVIAKETGHTEVAIAQLENVETSDTTASLLWGMALADSYMANGQTEKAQTTYDKVLEQHPDYWLALNNRAALNFKKGNNAEALEDFNALVEVRSKQVQAKRDTIAIKGLKEALVSRSTLHLKTLSLDKADEDINEASKLNPADPGINRIKKEVNEQKTIQSDRKANAEALLRVNPENTGALEEKASADKALGNEKEALSAAKAAVANNSTDHRVFSIILEEAVKTNDTNTFKKITKKADQAGVSRNELIQNAPLLEQRFRTNIRQ